MRRPCHADTTASTGNEQVLAAPLDLADQASTAAFVATGAGRCRSWSTAPPSWPRRKSGLRRAGSCSSRPTISVTSRWASDRIAVNALNPGRSAGTNLSRYMGDAATGPAGFEPNSTAVSWKTVQQGAATSVLLAASPLLDGVSGRYFEDCKEAELHQPGIRRGVAAYALDPGNAARLWQLSVDTLASEGSRASS
jgi:hypothetical protein